MIFCFIFSINAWSADKLVLRSEVHAEDGHLLQQAMVFETKKITFVRNSNSFCGPSREAFLGVLEKNMNPLLKSHQMFVEQIRLRIKQGGNKPSIEKSDVHESHFFINQFDLSGRKLDEKSIMRILSSGCDEQGWKLMSGAKLKINKKGLLSFMKIETISNGKNISNKEIPLKKLHCHGVGQTQSQSNVLDCPIEGFGLARLIEN